MKLTVRFGDHSPGGQVQLPIEWRTVIIELSDAQAEKLKRRRIAVVGRETIYETREVIALEDKASEEKA